MFPEESSCRTVDDSLSGNDMRESPLSVGIATLNATAKLGLSPGTGIKPVHDDCRVVRVCGRASTALTPACESARIA